MAQRRRGESAKGESPVETMAAQLRDADVLVVASPMWNYSVPFVLKQCVSRSQPPRSPPTTLPPTPTTPKIGNDGSSEEPSSQMRPSLIRWDAKPERHAPARSPTPVRRHRTARVPPSTIVPCLVSRWGGGGGGGAGGGGDRSRPPRQVHRRGRAAGPHVRDARRGARAAQRRWAAPRASHGDGRRLLVRRGDAILYIYLSTGDSDSDGALRTSEDWTRLHNNEGRHHRTDETRSTRRGVIVTRLGP